MHAAQVLYSRISPRQDTITLEQFRTQSILAFSAALPPSQRFETCLDTAASLGKFGRCGMPTGEGSVHAVIQPQHLSQQLF